MRTITEVDRRPLFYIPSGEHGTVLRADNGCVIIQMNEAIEGYKKHQVRFTSAHCGVYWWQIRLATVEQVYHSHFALVPWAADPSPPLSDDEYSCSRT